MSFLCLQFSQKTKNTIRLEVKFGLSEKHTKFEKIFLMVLTNQLIHLVSVKTMRKIFSNYVCFSKSPNFKVRSKIGTESFIFWFQDQNWKTHEKTEIADLENARQLRALGCLLMLILILFLIICDYLSSGPAEWSVGSPNESGAINLAVFKKTNFLKKMHFSAKS